MKKRPTSHRKASDTTRPLPDTVDEWLEEIQLAVTDASGEPFSRAVRKRSACRLI